MLQMQPFCKAYLWDSNRTLYQVQTYYFPCTSTLSGTKFRSCGGLAGQKIESHRANSILTGERGSTSCSNDCPLQACKLSCLFTWCLLPWRPAKEWKQLHTTTRDIWGVPPTMGTGVSSDCSEAWLSTSLLPVQSSNGHPKRGFSVCWNDAYTSVCTGSKAAACLYACRGEPAACGSSFTQLAAVCRWLHTERRLVRLPQAMGLVH